MIDLVVAFVLFIFMLALVCFCCCYRLSVNKDLYCVCSIYTLLLCKFAVGL